MVPFLRRTLAVVLLVALPVQAQVDGGVSDVPLVKEIDGLQGPRYLFNKPAFDKVNDELTRLQQVEREHKAEPSAAPAVVIGIIAGLAVGLLAGALITVPIVSAAEKLNK